MQQKQLKKAATKHIRSAKRALLSFIKKGDQEKLHGFRTSIKKLRALAQMAGQASRASRLLRSLKPICKIYKPCSEIKDGYQHLELQKKAQTLQDGLRHQTNNFYDRATGRLRWRWNN